MGFSENLNKALETRNITPMELSARVGMNESEMNMYLKYDIFPDPHRLEQIASCLNFKVSDLCDDNGLNYTSFGQELTKLRESESLSRKELADMIGITYNNLTKIELGITKITKELSDRLEIAFGSSYTSILKKYPDTISKMKAYKPKEEGNKKVVYIHVPETPEDIAKGKMFGNTIRKARKDLGITSKYVAELLGISVPTLYRLECGQIPKGTLFENIKKYLGVDLDKVEREFKKHYVAEEVKETPVVEETPITETEQEECVMITIKPEWIELLNYIDNDKEYRLAVTSVFNKKYDRIENAPQASMALRMISRDVTTKGA